MPPAPGRFSTKNCCLKMLDNGSATIRPSVSAAPPGANGAMILTGLFGQTCACEGLIAGHKRERRITPIFIILCPFTSAAEAYRRLRPAPAGAKPGGRGLARTERWAAFLLINRSATRATSLKAHHGFKRWSWNSPRCQGVVAITRRCCKNGSLAALIAGKDEQ